MVEINQHSPTFEIFVELWLTTMTRTFTRNDTIIECYHKDITLKTNEKGGKNMDSSKKNYLSSIEQ